MNQIAGGYAPFEEDRFVVRLHQKVLTESAIVACWLGGSVIRLPEDPYSDFFICLVYADEGAREVAWGQRHPFCQAILSYVPAKSVDQGAYRHSVLYGNGAQADFRFEAQTVLEPQSADSAIKILKETPDQWAARHQARSRSLPTWQSPLTSAEIQALDNRFWISFWKIHRQLWRGQSDGPFAHWLPFVADVLPPLLAQLPEEDPARQALIDLAWSRDVAATRRNLHRFGRAWLAARDAIVRRDRLAFTPDTVFERQLQRLLEKT
jgi:hypothetical protein